MTRVVKGKVMYVLVVLAMVAGIVVMPTAVSATNPPFIPDFSISATSGEAPLTITFTNLTTGGVHPYIKAEWDFAEGDGKIDFTFTGTETEVMQSATYT